MGSKNSMSASAHLHYSRKLSLLTTEGTLMHAHQSSWPTQEVTTGALPAGGSALLHGSPWGMENALLGSLQQESQLEWRKLKTTYVAMIKCTYVVVRMYIHAIHIPYGQKYW